MQKCLENGRGTIYSPSVLISWETVTFKMFNYPWGSLHMWFMLYIYECGAKSQFLTDKSESLMVLYKH